MIMVRSYSLFCTNEETGDVNVLEKTKQKETGI